MELVLWGWSWAPVSPVINKKNELILAYVDSQTNDIYVKKYQLTPPENYIPPASTLTPLPTAIPTSTPSPVYSKDWVEYSPGSASGQGISKGFGNPYFGVRAVLDKDDTPVFYWDAWDKSRMPEIYEIIHAVQWKNNDWMELGSGPVNQHGLFSPGNMNTMVLDPVDKNLIISYSSYRNYMHKFIDSRWVPWGGGGTPSSNLITFWSVLGFLPDNTPIAATHRGILPEISTITIEKFVDQKWRNFSDPTDSPGDVIDNSGGLQPELFVSPKGDVYVVWKSIASNKKYCVSVDRWEGSHWQKIFFSDTADPNAYSYFGIRPLCFDSKNNLYLTYQESISQNHRIHVKKWDGRQWHTIGYSEASPSGICDPGKSGVCPILQMTQWDYPIVFWQDVLSGGIYAKYFDGATWIPAGEGSASGNGIGTVELNKFYDAVINKNNELFLTYVKNQSQDIYVKKYQLTPPDNYQPPTSTPTFSPTESPISTPAPVYSKDWVEYHPGSASGQGISKGFGNVRMFLQTVLDKDDEPVIAWDSENLGFTNPVLHVLKWNGRNWLELGSNNLISPGGVISPAGLDKLTIDPSDKNLVLSLNNYRNMLLKYDGNSWVPWANGGIDDADGYEFFTDINFLPDNTPLAFYHNGYGPSPSHFRVRKFIDGFWKEFSPGSGSGNGIALSDAAGRHPKILINKKGEIYSVWTQNSHESPQLFVMKWSGEKWELVYTDKSPSIGENANGCWISSQPMSFDNEGNPILAYHKVNNNQLKGRIVKCVNGIWKPLGYDESSDDSFNDPGRNTGLPVVINTSWDYPIVFWYEKTQIYAKYYDGRAWKPLGDSAASGDGIGSMGWNLSPVSPVINKKNEIILTYTDSKTKDIYVKKYQLTPPDNYQPPTSTPTFSPTESPISTPAPVYSKDWVEYHPGSASGQGISNGFCYSGSGIQVILDKDNEPVIAWESSINESDTTIHVLKWTGANWTQLGRNQSISSEGVVNPAGLNRLTIDPSDKNLVLSMHHYKNILMKFYNNDWVPWAGGGIDDPDGYEFFTDIAFSSENTPIAFYHNGYGPVPSHFRVRKFIDGLWKEFSTGSASGNGIAMTDAPGLHPNISINNKGEIYTVWQQDTEGSAVLYVMKWSGIKWELVYTDKSPADGEYVNGCWISNRPMCFDNDGNPILAYHKVVNNANKGRIVKRINGIWKPLGYDEAGEDGFSEPGRSTGLPVVINTPWDWPIVFWYENTQIYAKIFDGNIWKPLGAGAASRDGIGTMGWSWSPVSTVINKNNEVILVYVNAQNKDIYVKKYQLTPPEKYLTPTPVPTPATTLDWFVLDGFGGVHSSNPSIPLPVLPYFMPFNIARDLEPDPLGRGWYMLDGFGGIHTSSPDLPKPIDLPYFGYDIARNLEVVNTDHGYEFYMLDGYGTIHSTDKSFQQEIYPGLVLILPAIWNLIPIRKPGLYWMAMASPIRVKNLSNPILCNRLGTGHR